MLEQPPKRSDRIVSKVVRSYDSCPGICLCLVLRLRSVQRRRRFTAEEKRQFVGESFQPGTNIWLVARRPEISPSLLFRWRKLAQEGSFSAVQADESVVPVSHIQVLEQQIHQLQRLLGKKTQECKILREAVEVGRAKKVAIALYQRFENMAGIRPDRIVAKRMSG